MRNRLRILVGRPPHVAGHGGAEWALLQYVLGLRRLGHEAEFAADAGVDGTKFDVVLNTSGILSREMIDSIPIRIYLDLDPAFNQLWSEDGIDRGFDGHTHFATVGLGIGRDGCDVPTQGVHWICLLPPVVLDEWPPADAVETDALTTVANFRAYGSIEREGVKFGEKVHSIRVLIGLPRRVQERFVLAMKVYPGDVQDRAALDENGWELIDPGVVAATPEAYRHFVRGSRSEIGIAKSGYVMSRCGWFSDRSACYLASGRPVVAQDTGFSRFLPTGKGLFAFGDEDGAVAAIEEIRGDYTRQSRAAREFAEEHLDSDRVLSGLLKSVGA